MELIALLGAIMMFVPLVLGFLSGRAKAQAEARRKQKKEREIE